MQYVIKKYILICFVIILCFVGIGLLLRHHYMDYDFTAMLRTAHLSFSSQKMKNVSSLSQISHVFVIMEENHDWQKIYKSPDAPYINNTLLTQGTFAKNYHNVPENLTQLHPSEPNYILF